MVGSIQAPPTYYLNSWRRRDYGQSNVTDYLKNKPTLNQRTMMLIQCTRVCVYVLLSRWSEVKQDLTHTSVRLHSLLQAWKRYSDLLSSCSEKLQQEKDRLRDVSKTASEHHHDTETLATCVQRLHVSHVKKQPVRNIPFASSVVEHIFAFVI